MPLKSYIFSTKGQSMYQIPNVIYPLPDEILLSYLDRLSSVNGVSIRDLLSCYTTLKIDTKDHLFVTANYLKSFQKLLPVLDSNINAFDFLSQTSTLPAFYPFMINQVQTKTMHSILGYPKLLPKVQTYPIELHYCIECESEDKETYHFTYTHRSHCVPGVCCCYKHHTPLYNSKTHEPLTSNVTEADKVYATFTHDSLNDWLPCNYLQARNAIMDRVRSVNYSDLLSNLSDSMYAPYFDCDVDTFIRSIRPSQAYISIKSLIMLSAALFGSFKAFKTEVHKYMDAPSYKASAAYTVINKHPILSMYHCNICGTDFYESPHSIANGWMCPVCAESISDTDYLRRIVSASTDGDYELVGTYDGIQSSISLLHHTCNQEVSIGARSFLYDGVRCQCMRTSSFKEIAESLPDGYELLSYVSKNQKVTVRATNCGHEFDVFHRKLIRFPGCRVCTKLYESEDGYKQSVHDLVGDEYTLSSEYIDRKTPVFMTHKKCGISYPIAPKHFLNGQRCPLCTPQLPMADTQDYVSKLSSGRYTVTERYQVSGQVFVCDNETGVTKKVYTSFLIQELTRPTPSVEFPHIQPTEHVSYVYTDVAKIVDYVLTQLPRSEPFEIQGVWHAVGLKYTSTKHAMKKLVSYNVVRKLGNGVYEFVNKEEPDEISKRQD